MARRARSERGAVAVEAALVTPLLALLVFGIIEMSLLMRDAVGVTNQVRAGARIAAVEAGAGPGPAPNYTPVLAQDTATAIENAGSSMPLSQINWVIVYKANSSGYPGPDTNTTNLSCTVASTTCIKFVYDATSGKLKNDLSSTWNTSTINACVNDPARQSVGVAMSARHTWVTGLFGSGIDVPSRLKMQFEPLPSTTCGAGKHS